MWKLYDALIDGIPADLHVKRAAAGSFWTCVESELGVGTAITGRELTRPRLVTDRPEKMTLRQTAALSKSWNVVEAAIGIAAINAYYNTPEIAEKNGVLLPHRQEDDRMNDPYIAYRNLATGKKVAGIGHFQYMVALLGDVCELTMIGGEEQGNYPLSAAEFLLPEQDYIYLPCTVIISKELPRFLKLCSGGRVIICGPSIPMAPLLFDYGIFDLSGFVVLDNELAFEAALGAGIETLFLSGKKTSLRQI